MAKQRAWHRFIYPVIEHFRRKRGEFILRLFPDIGNLKVCDLGGSRHFWEALSLPVNMKNITIYNIGDGWGDTASKNDDNQIQVIVYDGKHIPCPDKHFDLLICNSVLEHVPEQDRANLAAEMRRVAKRLFIQTPAKSFPIEPHFVMPFVHWLPRSLGFLLVHISPYRLLSRPTKETITNYFHGTKLLSGREMQRLFPSENLHREKVLGLTKSYYVYR